MKLKSKEVAAIKSHLKFAAELIEELDVPSYGALDELSQICDILNRKDNDKDNIENIESSD